MLWLILLGLSGVTFIGTLVFIKNCNRKYRYDEGTMTKMTFLSNWRKGYRMRNHDRCGCFVIYHPDGTYTVGGSANVYKDVRDEYVLCKSNGNVRFFYCSPAEIYGVMKALREQYPNPVKTSESEEQVQ